MRRGDAKGDQLGDIELSLAFKAGWLTPNRKLAPTKARTRVTGSKI